MYWQEVEFKDISKRDSILLSVHWLNLTVKLCNADCTLCVSIYTCSSSLIIVSLSPGPEQHRDSYWRDVRRHCGLQEQGTDQLFPMVSNEQQQTKKKNARAFFAFIMRY